jgi:hypothetical protein
MENDAVGEAPLQAREETLVALSPLPSTTHDRWRVAMISGSVSNSSSMPFCTVRRVTIPSSGVLEIDGRFSQSRNARLVCACRRRPAASSGA